MSKRFVYYGGTGGGIITAGLILHYDAGNDTSYPEPKNGTTVFDLTTPQENGALIGGVGYDVANGGSFVFDGVDDYINYGSNNIGSTYSITMWLNLVDLSSRSWLQGQTGSQGNYHFNILGGDFLTRLNSSSSKSVVLNVAINEWVAVTMVRNYDSIDVYKNGVYQGVMTDPLWTTDFIIEGNIYGFLPKGKQGNAYIYNRIITSAEITQNYNAEKARYGL
jgi:hypothetical protein